MNRTSLLTVLLALFGFTQLYAHVEDEATLAFDEVPDAVEYAALVALYNSTNGDGWNRNDNWLQDTNFATWYGVTVRNGDVTGLALNHNQLTGEIPEELGNLTNLTSLLLHYNRLEGTIPASFGQLTKVTRLDLYVNRLSGIPNFRTSHPDPNKLQLRVQNNRISLNDIAQNLTGPDTHSFSLFQYHSQGNAQDTISIVPVLGETLTLEGFLETPPHPQTNYQWQQQVSGEWGDIEDANGSSLTLVGVTAADTGFYRFRITNDWIEGVVQQSLTYHLVLDEYSPIWLEAECATVGTNWVTRESNSASGGQYLVYPSGGRANSPPTAAADQLKLVVEVTEARAYYLLGRINAPTPASNSFWIRINDQPWIEWWEDIATGSGFGWNVAPGGPIELSAGTHTITVGHREAGTQLDKLLLSTTDQAPEGVGESVTCEDPDDYTPPTPPSLVNNPPDGSTAPAIGGSRPGSQSNSNVNYVRSFTPREQYDQPSQVNLSQSVGNVSVSTEYLDGLGRPIQTVVRGGSGSASQDLVQPVEYDQFGRQVKQYLPYAASEASGAYRPNGVQNQYDFYTASPSNVARSGYAYAETKFEPSPLNRPVEQAAPGENWRLGSGHEVETKYLVNAAGEVRQWMAGNLAGTSLSTSKNYDAGTLYKTVVTDENGHTTTEFRDKLDQVVLKRVQGPDGSMDTYYVHDSYNLLRFVIPPEASKQLVDNASLASNADFRQKYLFVYDYDNRRRLISEQVPGGGTTTLKYDQWDRLVLSQSALQASKGQWSFTKYDQLNRPIITGVTTSATVSGSRFETKDGSTVGYTLSGSPHSVSEAQVRTVTYYDDYGFPHAGSYGFSDNIAARSFHPDVRGQVTGSKTRNLDDNSWLNSVVYYDEQYRPIQAVSDNHLGGRDRITTTYRNAVNSEMMVSKREHSSTSEPTRTITQNYSYDHAGRLTGVTHQLDNQAAVTLSAQQYNAIGELINNQLGNNQQAVDYRYNIRGWLTRINDLGSSARYFNQELYYDFGFEQKQHNGNISGIRWNRAGGKAHAYGYRYDQADRITGADYRVKPLLGNWATSPGNFTVDQVAYDLNGNITDLKRYGEQDERQYLWDNLEYKYDGNRLRAVGELPEGQAEVGFVDGVAGSATAEYGYDLSGNMTSDANKGISAITYDPVLNLPTEVEITGKGTIKYTYDASGTKLRQEVLPSDGSPAKTTDYVSGFHYTDGQLDFIQHEEGRLMIKDGLAYHYDLKDHLGNVRVTFSSVPVTMTVMATMEASAAPVEEAVFEGVAESRQTLAYHNTTTASSSEPQPNKVATLQPGEQGPAKSVAVHAGDTVRLKVNARYETVPAQVQGLEGVATEVAGAVSRSAAGLESGGAVTGSNGLAAGSALTTGKEQEVPQAYLNYLLYDENYQLVDQGFQQVSQAAAVGKANPSATPEALALEVPIQEEGFLYTYLSNGPSASASLVYFDDFTVEQRSYIVAVHDYYPFGADFDQQSVVGVASKYRYQGKELQAELGLDLYDFHARQYDPLLGRFTSVDPMAASWDGMSPYVGMANNPISYVDPDGRNPIIVGAMIGSVAGFGIGYASGLRGNELLASTLGGAALGAGVGFGINGGLAGFGQGVGSVAGQVSGAASNLARRVLSGIGPTVGMDVATQAASSITAGPITQPGQVVDDYGLSRADYGSAYQPSRYAGMNTMQYHQAKVGDAFIEHPITQGAFDLATLPLPFPKFGLGKMLGRGASKYVNLASRARTKHILSGDLTGGGHAWFGSLKSFMNGVTRSKSMFPSTWSNSKIMHGISEVVTSNPWVQQTGRAGQQFTRTGNPVRFKTEGYYRGLKIRVIHTGDDIITAFPVR